VKKKYEEKKNEREREITGHEKLQKDTRQPGNQTAPEKQKKKKKKKKKEKKIREE